MQIQNNMTSRSERLPSPSLVQLEPSHEKEQAALIQEATELIKIFTAILKKCE